MLISVIKTRSFGIWPLKSAFTLRYTHTHNIIWWKKICDGNSALLHFCTKRNIVILDFVICTFVIVCVHCSHYRWLQIQAKKSHVKVSNRWIRYLLNLRLAWELIAFFDQVSVWLKLGGYMLTAVSRCPQNPLEVKEDHPCFIWVRSPFA